MGPCNKSAKYTLLLQLLTGTIFSDLSSNFVFRVLNLAILNSTER